MRGFLWCQGTMQLGRAKVAWDVICLLKKEGCLGLRKLELFNKALMTSHVWDILRRKESLWIKWIHVYKIRERNFWDLPLRGLHVVKDAISDGNWNWPPNWITKYHALNNIVVPNIVQDGVDILEWRVHGGLVKQFSVAAV
ncbi:hypothetical protein Tco_1169573 [Tanacetum coccineum]